MTSNINCSVHLATIHLILQHCVNIRKCYCYTKMHLCNNAQANDRILSETHSLAVNNVNNFLFLVLH